MKYITPEKAVALGAFPTIEAAEIAARSKKKCYVCGRPAWRFAQTNLCFTCTTGESNSSQDYELERPKMLERWGIYTINGNGNKVWIHPKAGKRQCFFSSNAAIAYGRLAFPDETLYVVNPNGTEQRIEKDD